MKPGMKPPLHTRPAQAPGSIGTPVGPGAVRATPSYARFIPREELADFAAWTPDSLGGTQPAGSAAARGRGGLSARAEAAPPPPPTPDEWLAQVQAARKAGYQDGLRDGQAALEAAQRQTALQISGQVAQLLASFDEQMQGLEARMAEAVTHTAVTLARQVLRAELVAQPDVVTRVAQEAVATLMLSARHIHLRLHPQDHDLVAEACAELLRARHVTLAPDPTIERGGCLAESDLGKVDARIDSRWAQAAAVFGLDDAWCPPTGESGAAADAADARADPPRAVP
jgi:flagellar assembly protein FliH